MSNFDELPKNEGPDDSSLGPLTPEQISSFTPEQKAFAEKYFKYAREVIGGEVVEWSEKIEEATTPEERKEIIFLMVWIGEMEKGLTDVQSPKTKGEFKIMINETREKAGLPPKYSIEV